MKYTMHHAEHWVGGLVEYNAFNSKVGGSITIGGIVVK